MMTDIKGERLQIIDGIRGLSLAGILMANMLIFQYGIWGKEEIHLYSPSKMDSVAYTFTKIFIEGSFMPIFAFLFGFGMIKMKQSLDRKNLKYKQYFFRRFLFLLVVGFLHSTYLWEGDILFFYGLMGLFLLIFVGRKKKTLLLLGSTLLLLFSLLGYGSQQDTLADPVAIEAYVKKTITVYSTGTYEEIKYHRNNVEPGHLPDYVYLFLLLFAPFFTAPMFLFGMYAAKNNWFKEPDKKRQMYLKAAIFLTLSGILLKSAHHFFPQLSWTGVADLLGASILAFGYIFVFAFLYTRFENSFWLRGCNCVGKLSLSNYLLQTVICTTIFYGYGFGLFGKLGVLTGIFLSIGIFMLQIIGSYWYLKRFKYGPVEKLLRMWTYFSFLGTLIRKKSSVDEPTTYKA